MTLDRSPLLHSRGDGVRTPTPVKSVLPLVMFILLIGPTIWAMMRSTNTHLARLRALPPDSNRVCRVQSPDAEFTATSKKAFAVVTQTSIPRAYHLGFESFLKNNPNTTLYVYGNVDRVDPRFAEHGLRVVLVPLDLADIQRQLVEALPDLDRAVFQTDVWTTTIRASMAASPMILSDFVRLSLLFLHGGSWLDADALYLRPFTMRNALPCHDHITSGRGSFWIQCNEDATLHLPFDDSLAVVPGRTWYCTNGILGQFAPRHPFLRKTLLQMVVLYPDLDVNPGLRPIALGGHLLVSTLITTTSANNVSDPRLRVSEWPLLYDLNQMYGFWDADQYVARYAHQVPAMMADLRRRNVFSVQLFHWIYESPDAVRDYFQPGRLHYELWQNNCVFSCNEPVL